MKKTIFLLLIQCSIAMMGMEGFFDKNFGNNAHTHTTTGRVILACCYKLQELAIKKQEFQDYVPFLRKEFVSFFKKNIKELNECDYPFYLGGFHECKQYYLGNNKENPVFFDDETFDQIRPFIINKERIESDIKDRGDFDFFRNYVTDPELMNELIYKYYILKPKQKSVGSRLLTGVNNILGFVAKVFQKEYEIKDLNKVRGLNQSKLVAILHMLYEDGFFMDDKVYTRADPFISDFLRDVEMPYALPQTSDVHIAYLKTVFTPRCYGEFTLKGFSDSTKKWLLNFLLSLKRWSKKNLPFKVPKNVINIHILPQLRKYDVAQRIRPMLVEDISFCNQAITHKDFKKAVEFIKNEFLNWFDQEALR